MYGIDIFRIRTLLASLLGHSTFMGIAIHNLSSSGDANATASATDLADAVRQSANGLLGTTVQLADLVRVFSACYFVDLSIFLCGSTC
jgi:solute carrier family 39 (zinc transporter), member 7